MKNKPLFAKASVSALCVMLSCYSLSVFATNSTGNVTVDGEEYTVADYSKIQISGNTVDISGGTGNGLQIYDPNTSASIAGDKVSVSGNLVGMWVDPSKNGNGSAQVDVLGKNISISGQYYALWLQYKGNVNIGSSETEELNLIGQTVITSNKVTGDEEYSGSQVKLKAKTINITNDSNGYTLHTMNRTQKESSPEGASHLIVEADDIVVKGNLLGISAHSNGIVDITGNLTVTAPNAIDTRGNSTININTDGKHTTQLNGDIVFETPGEKHQSGTIVNSYVNVNLTGSDSYWTGAVYLDTNENKTEDSSNVSGLNLALNEGATWNTRNQNKTEYDNDGQTQYVSPLAVNSLTSNGGVINIENTKQVVEVEKLSGESITVNTKASVNGDEIQAGQLSVGGIGDDGAPDVTLNFNGITSDDIADKSKDELKSVVRSAFKVGNDDEASYEGTITATTSEGDIAGDYTTVFSPDGTVTVQEAQNTVNASLLDIASSNYLFFRSQINDVSARMGDLRSMPKTAGAWVRYYGGKNKYSDKGQKEKYNTLQLGADAFINNNFYLGGTFSYTDGDGTLRNGSTDDKNYNFGIYGGWVGDAGQFVDVIIKRHRVETDFDLYNANGLSSGSYHNWGTTASVEAGWRLQCPNTGFYTEPQVELQLGRLDSVNYTTSKGVRVEQDGINSIIGRAGVAVGYTFPENKGTAYAKASVLHDWKGEVKSTFSANGQTRTYRDDLGGTWGEFAVGGTYNPTQNLSAYGQVKTSTGSPVRNPWQVSVGLRYNF